MDAKKEYETPEAEVIGFTDGDIITASDTRLNFQSLPFSPSTPSLPSIPSLPDLPDLPSLF